MTGSKCAKIFYRHNIFIIRNILEQSYVDCGYITIIIFKSTYPNVSETAQLGENAVVRKLTGTRKRNHISFTLLVLESS